ncbi:MAG: baseplate J/gp47 family protein [Spirochaetaceae bacterium]|nr:baseplate J/gp47 family protein [Spirochaetaceae bacterium]
MRGFIEVLAGVVFFIYKTAINPIYANATLDGATGVFLSFWGLALGVVRKSDNKAAGSFTGHSYGEGNVPSGSWIVLDGTELRYKVTAKTAFTADSDFAIPVEAEFSGSDYNIGSGMPLRITRVVNGLNSVTVPENWQSTLGENTEEDDSYRERVKNRWRSQTLGDTKETYKFYAETVAGVRAAKIIRTPRGPGSTDVIIASVTGLPTPELLAGVEAALYDHELMGFDVQVKAPAVTNIAIVIEFSGEADEADIALIAEGYVHDLGIGGRFALKDLYALYEPLGLATVEIVSPSRDVQAGEAAVIIATIDASKVG